MEIHNVIARVSGSRVFEVVFQAMNEWLREQRSIALRLPGQTDIAYWEHKAVVDAIVSQDPDAAEAAMYTHLINVEKT